MTFSLRIVTLCGASNLQYRVYTDMNDITCDLCGVDDALPDGLLCPACREAVARVLMFAEAQSAEANESVNATIKSVDHPETTQNTRKARP